MRTIDLRGSGSPAYGAVLADPSGRRAARLRKVGVVVAVVFLLWLFGLVLAGLGLLPLSDLPLGHALKGASQPPELPAAARPAPPTAGDLVPARAAKRATAARTTNTSASPSTGSATSATGRHGASG